MIDKISNATREAIAATSAKSLPDNPSGRGMTPNAIRDTFWKPIVAAGNSVADEIDRVAGEANTDIGAAITKAETDLAAEKTAREASEQEIREDFGVAIDAAITKAENELADEKRARETSENGIRENIASVSKALEDHKAEISVEANANKIPKRTPFGTLEAETKRLNDTQYPRRMKQLVNLGFFDAEMDAHKAEVDKTFNTLEAQISGRTTSYVIAGRSTLVDLLSGQWEMGSETYYDDYLRTGDTILCIDTDLPDFWFERTTDTSRVPETFVYTDESGNERTITLRVLGYDNGGKQVGLLHILESNAVNFGDLEAVLEAIIAYQEQLIGGYA